MSWGWWKSKMGPLHKFASLAPNERDLFARTLVLLWLVRLGLWLLPYERLCRLLFRKGTRIPETLNNLSVPQIVRSVKAMSRYVPAATCLTKALVTVMLLRHAGQEASVRIGVARSQFGAIEAHAWVESDGHIVIGGSHADISRYTVLRPV